MKIDVFIENESGKNIKNIYDEKNREYIKSYEVSRKYPYPYGFMLNTTSGDGDNLDVFVLTNRAIKHGQVYNVRPIAVLRQIDDGEQDDNIIAVFDDEDIELDDESRRKLIDFINHVFDHLDQKMEGLKFEGTQPAIQLIESCKDS